MMFSLSKDNTTTKVQLDLKEKVENTVYSSYKDQDSIKHYIIMVQLMDDEYIYVRCGLLNECRLTMFIDNEDFKI